MLSERGDDLLVGAIMLALVPLLVLRIVRALHSGSMPLYRRRVTRAETGNGKFTALIVLNALAALGLLVMAADLLLGLGLRPA